MTAKGKFEVQLKPQNDDEVPAGRMLINKSYKGTLEGMGRGLMISKRLENGTAAYFAIEEFSGQLDDKSGGFTLLHRGSMNAESQSLDITVLEGSGSGELRGISGTMNIVQEEGKHFYELDYTL
ncbi:MAG TPA: DUF3224 domain-containing protein [Fodinibius sp.]|nr:DUF3224 domain-containing protein [Fodinibius sp.]